MSDPETLQLAKVAAAEAAAECLRETPEAPEAHETEISSVAFHMEASSAQQPTEEGVSDTKRPVEQRAGVVLTLSGGIILVLFVFAAWSGGLTFMDAVDLVLLKIVPLSITAAEGVLHDPENRLPWIVLLVAGVIVGAGAIFNGRNVYNIYQVLAQYQKDPATNTDQVLKAVEQIEDIVIMSTYVTWALTAVQFVTFVVQLAIYETACRRTNVVWVLQVSQFGHYIVKSLIFPAVAFWFHRMALFRTEFIRKQE